jgi:hypothetical protein
VGVAFGPAGGRPVLRRLQRRRGCRQQLVTAVNRALAAARMVASATPAWRPAARLGACNTTLTNVRANLATCSGAGRLATQGRRARRRAEWEDVLSDADLRSPARCDNGAVSITGDDAAGDRGWLRPGRVPLPAMPT